MRLLLRPFWDKSRAVVATWLAEYCIRFLAVHNAFARQGDIEFPQEMVLQLAEQQIITVTTRCNLKDPCK